jgi:5-methylcytosine-specific restriction endonuclease McrA
VKICRVCKEEKPLDAFHRRSGAKDGRRNDCRDCNLAAQARYTAATSAKRAEKDRRDYLAERERIIEERRAFRAREADRINRERRKRRAEDPERFRALQRAAYERNREAIIARVAARKFRRRQVKIELLVERDGLVCGICGEGPLDIATAHIDHIYPRSLGGDNSLANLQLAHAFCNISKQARVPPALPCREAA